MTRRYTKSRIDIESLARAHTPSAIKTLSHVMRNKDSPPNARVAAAVALLDRGWGKPKQEIQADIMHRYVIEVPNLLSDAEWEIVAQAQQKRLPNSDSNPTPDKSNLQ